MYDPQPRTLVRVCAASVHAGLASLVEREGANLEGRRILMYSYGSGLAASLWSVVGRRVEGKWGPKQHQQQGAPSASMSIMPQFLCIYVARLARGKLPPLQKRLAQVPASQLPVDRHKTCQVSRPVDSIGCKIYHQWSPPRHSRATIGYVRLAPCMLCGYKRQVVDHSTFNEAMLLQTRIQERLEARRKAEPAEFVSTLELPREAVQAGGFRPQEDP